jgi:hypothetical protein
VANKVQRWGQRQRREDRQRRKQKQVEWYSGDMGQKWRGNHASRGQVRRERASRGQARREGMLEDKCERERSCKQGTSEKRGKHAEEK